MAKNLTLIFGIVFVVVGLLGFIGGLGIVGPTGIFATNTLHDVVHLLTGIVLILVAVSAPSKSKSALIIFGVVYLLVTIVGFVVGEGEVLGILMNSADHYLHLVLTIVLLIGAFASKSDTMVASM